MKTAEDVAEGIVHQLPTSQARRLWGPILMKLIAQALTAYAEERVKEAWDLPPPWFIRTEEFDKARNEALEEAAKIADECCSDAVLGNPAFHIRDAIRALKQ